MRPAALGHAGYPGPFGVMKPRDLSQERASPLLRERDIGRIARVAGLSRRRVPLRARIGLTRRLSATSLSNVTPTRYRLRNNREILPKPAHGTHALQEYGAAGVEPASTLDPAGPLPPWRRSESISPLVERRG